MLLPSLLKSGDQVYQKVIKQLYQKMLLLNLLITLKRAAVDAPPATPPIIIYFMSGNLRG